MNSRREPRDPAAYKRDRRQAVLRHHPDKGGDPDALLRALAAVDRKHGVAAGPRGGEHSATAEQVAAVAVTALAGVAAVGLSVAMSIMGRRR